MASTYQCIQSCSVSIQGIVKVKRNMVDGELLAVKVMDYQTFRGQFTSVMWDEIRYRQSVVERLCHPCLVKVRGSFFDEKRRSVTVFMDYVKGPSLDAFSGTSSSVNLKTVLEKRPPWWTKPILSIVILGVAHGIDYIHNQGCVHRDIKPSNVLIDERFHPKICDLDVCRPVDDDTMTIEIGTFKYMAPECASGHYSARSDYYSFGVLLYDVFECLDSTPQDFANPDALRFSEDTPTEIQEFIRKLLTLDEDERGYHLICDVHPLFASLYNIIVNYMGLDEGELMNVKKFVENIEKVEEEIIANQSEEY